MVFRPDIAAIDDLASPFGLRSSRNRSYVYRGQDGDIDYSTPVAIIEAGDTQVHITDQALPPNTIWHYVRKDISPCCGKLSPASDPCVVAIDENGDMVLPTPNAPHNVTLEKLGGGKLRVRWLYSRTNQQIAPSGFFIYIDADGSGFDLSTPDGTKRYQSGSGRFKFDTPAYAHNTLLRVLVRSYRTAGGISQNTRAASEPVDAQGPLALSKIYASYTEI